MRALELTDLDMLMKFWNNLEIRKFLMSAVPMSRNAEKQWLEEATKHSPWKDGRIVLAVEDKKTQEFLGTVSLFDISAQCRHAEFGIALHNPENLGKGYGTDTTKVMLWFGFHLLGLNTIYLYAQAENKRAIRTYEKAGFKMIGTYRQSCFSLGEFKDQIAMDITAEEFMQQYPTGTMVGEP
ncbi:MAG: GNAT family protein [Candidatus Thorarchaeota archaeon]